MSGSLDEDTLRSMQQGRETVGGILGSARGHLQKAFIVWVFGLIGSIAVLQYGLWDVLKQDLLYEKMGLTTAEATRIITLTPFDVILLQIKIGTIVGILLAVPVLIFYSRHGLRNRGMWPTKRMPRWKFVSLAAAGTLLFLGGVLYSYELFFPLMFEFLAGNAIQAGFQPNYSIVKWTQFVVMLGVSFGLAAQLPLAMTSLAWTGIVPYETFRDRWKWAFVGIFAFGAVFSPPDPFTQIMWATPLCFLYVFSLGLTKLVVLTKRAGSAVRPRAVARERWNVLAGTIVLVAGVVYYLLATEGFRYVRAFAEWFPSSRLTGDIQPPELFGLSVSASGALLGLLLGLLVAAIILYYFMVQRLDVAAVEAGHFGDPTDLDIGPLSAAAIQQAPPEVFEKMDESTALQHADTALQDDDHEKAEAILDRWDRAQERADAEDAGDAAEGEAAEADDEGNVFANTAAGMMDAFTEDETTEDDIGGYYYDLRFIVDSLTSNLVWIFAIFAIVTSVTFVFLYAGVPGANAPPVAENASVLAQNGTAIADNLTIVGGNITVLDANGTSLSGDGVLAARFSHTGGRPTAAVIRANTTVVENGTVLVPTPDSPGTRALASNVTVLIEDTVSAPSTSGIGIIKNTFVSELPPDLQQDVAFVTLHPVEHLVFIVKFSVLLGFIVALPLILYFAWPAMGRRNIVSGDRKALLAWGGSIVVTLVLGSLVGFLWIAPEIISWLAADALNSYMEVTYRVAKFGWLVLALTVGIGLLIEIPVTMVLFHRAGILPYRRLMAHWRGVTIGIFLFGSLATPKDPFTMFLLSIPIAIMFLVGLAILWLMTLGGRAGGGKRTEPAG